MPFPRLNTDYAFIQKAIPLLGLFGIAGHLTFPIILTMAFGYWDSWWLRVPTAAIYATLLLFPRDRALGRGLKTYFELVMAITLPGLFTFLFLMNNANKYWFSSLVFAGLLHGLLSKPYLFTWSYPMAAWAATHLFFSGHPEAAAVVKEGLQAQLAAYFLGLVSTGIKTGMEIGHEKITRSQVALARAESDLKLAEETRRAYEELKKREDLLRVYVRPSLVEEIKAGMDPSKAEPVIRNLAILFCDIRDFTSLTEALNPYEKQTFLNQYFTMMTHPIVKNGGEVDKIMGDCVMGLFPDGDSATRAAVDMRLALQAFNQKMFALGQPKIRNGIGIAKGEVLQGNFGSYEKLDRTVIGEAVNIASRLESKTKMYNLEVVVTEDVIQDLRPGTPHVRWIDVVQVKGSTRHLKLFEIYGHQPEEVRKYKDDTREMLEKALTIYFQKGFQDAQRLFRAMLAAVPPHRHIPTELMDTLLRYYIDHCDAWTNDPNGAWEKVERWEGVHVFHDK